LKLTFSGQSTGIPNSSAIAPTGLAMAFPRRFLLFGGCVTTPTTSKTLIIAN